jgi:hypothetical protein
MGKPEGEGLLRRSRRGWEYNTRIKRNVVEIGLDVKDWTDLAKDRAQWRALVNTVVAISSPMKFSGIFELLSD